jgi:hypothetical protein
VRKGRIAALVVAAEEWQRKTVRVGNLAEFFAASPLRGSGLKAWLFDSEPKILRIIGKESKQKGTNKLSGQDIEQIVKTARRSKSR